MNDHIGWSEGYTHTKFLTKFERSRWIRLGECAWNDPVSSFLIWTLNQGFEQLTQKLKQNKIFQQFFLKNFTFTWCKKAKTHDFSLPPMVFAIFFEITLAMKKPICFIEFSKKKLKLLRNEPQSKFARVQQKIEQLVQFTFKKWRRRARTSHHRLQSRHPDPSQI